MTIGDAVRRLENSVGRSPDTVAIRVVLDALEEAQRERDQLISLWPNSGSDTGTVYRINEGPYAGRWFVSGLPGDYPTLEAAVRRATGLDRTG